MCFSRGLPECTLTLVEYRIEWYMMQRQWTLEETIDHLRNTLNISPEVTRSVWDRLEHERGLILTVPHAPTPPFVEYDEATLQRIDAELALAALVPLPDDDDDF